MQPISVEKFADMVMKNNKGYHKKELVKTLRETLAAKKNGARCMVCGAPIWAAGSAITGSNLCFTCTTGEADDSEDYDFIHKPNPEWQTSSPAPCPAARWQLLADHRD